MSKLSKHANVLDRLQQMVAKEAAAAADKNKIYTEASHTTNSEVTAPAKDEAVIAASPMIAKIEVTDTEKKEEKKEEKPEEKKEEKKEASAKSITELGTEILSAISKIAASEAAATPAVTPAVAVEKSAEAAVVTAPAAVAPTETAPAVATEVLDPKLAASQEEIDKIASYELGRQFVAAILKQAEEKEAIDKIAAEIAFFKEAGRREFEALIAQATAELQGEKLGADAFDTMLQQQTEAQMAGANAFKAILKEAEDLHTAEQARQEYTALLTNIERLNSENETLKQASVELASARAELLKTSAVLEEKAKEDREAAKFASIAEYLKSEIVKSLKQEARD